MSDRGVGVRASLQATWPDGALTGTPRAGDATLRFSAMSDVAAMVETMPLERAAEAYARMMSGEARFGWS